MEFLQLNYFRESAKNESFALTAKKYMVPTSSVSASIKRLENEIGTKLFDRTSNRIKLNEKGYAFLKMLDEVFDRINTTVSAISDTAQQNANISILIKARRKWIAELIIKYKQQFPYVNFQISHDALNSRLEDFDIIIDEKNERYTEKSSFLLIIEQICVKAAKNHSLTKETLTFGELKDQPFIVSQKGGRMWQLLDKTAARSGFTPKIAIESNDRQCIIRYVESGMGLYLGSRRALVDDSEKNLAALNVVDFDETQSIYVYHTPFEKCSVSLKGFIAFLKENGHDSAL